VNILVLSKHKTDTKTQFIDASRLFLPQTNTNILTDNNIKEIIDIFDTKEDISYFAQSVEHKAIAQNDYNLSVSSYVEAEDTREKIDIVKLNQELKTTVKKIDKLRIEIDAIVGEIEV
jgi:type I restriction enzyme M protein